MTQQLENDLGLARRVARGDRAAFREFFETYFPRLYRFALARTDGSHATAEDVAQKTLCNVMFKIDKYRGESSLLTWLCQICRNELATHYRRASSDPARHTVFEDSPSVRAALESLSADATDPEHSRRDQEIRRVVQVILDYLPPKYATVLEMKYIHGERVAAIAAHLRISDKAAESLVARARAAFRDGFDVHFGADREQFV